jgi:hypothetical protein
MAEAEPYWKSLWGEKAQHNERAEWIRREERSKISNMDWGPKQIMEITSFFFIKPHNWTSPGNDKIENNWLNTFPVAQRYIIKSFNAIMEESRVGTWLANHRNNSFATKIRRQQGIQELPTHYVRNNHVHNPNWNSQKNFHTHARAELTTSTAKRISPRK